MDSSQDRNLPASQQKLDKARKDGQVSRSREMSNLAVLGGGACALLILSPMVFARLKMELGQQLMFNAETLVRPEAMFGRAQNMIAVGLLISVAFAFIVAATMFAGTVISSGWVVSLKPITPDFKRLNPLSGAANLFTRAQLANVAKLIVLTVILTTVTWSYLSSTLQKVAMMMQRPSMAALQDLGSWMVSGISLLMLVVFIAAVIDVPLQTFLFKGRLKMSHEEVKQEHKSSEGNPHIKGTLRQRAREMSQRRSLADVPKADFVVMNPTHFAVAIRYDEATMAAPQVISKGADLLAMKIREIATAHSVPVLQSPMLARALYAHAEIDQAIPSALYTAVAQVLAYVYRLKAALRGHGPMPGEVPEPFVPAELDPLAQTVATANNDNSTGTTAP